MRFLFLTRMCHFLTHSWTHYTDLGFIEFVGGLNITGVLFKSNDPIWCFTNHEHNEDVQAHYFSSCMWVSASMTLMWTYCVTSEKLRADHIKRDPLTRNRGEREIKSESQQTINKQIIVIVYIWCIYMLFLMRVNFIIHNIQYTSSTSFF